MNWMLIVIDGAEGEIEHISTGDLDSILHPEGPVLHGITQGDPEMAERIITDLSRVGARYAEFIGGTVVLASVDNGCPK
jgi:hypothetical protein